MPHATSLPGLLTLALAPRRIKKKREDTREVLTGNIYLDTLHGTVCHRHRVLIMDRDVIV